MLSKPSLHEASGICRSLVHDGVYYVHNDSGHKPVLHAVDSTGRSLQFSVAPFGISTTDAEDCTSAVVNGTPLLVLADTGDNQCRRPMCAVIVMEEPRATSGALVVTPQRVIRWSYPDGRRRNCEACALLAPGVLLVVTKSFPDRSGPTTMFEIRSPLCGDAAVSVRAVQTFPASMGVVTAMDVMGTTMVLLGTFRGSASATVLNLITHAVEGVVVLPHTTQPEGICYTHDGTQLLVVSEVDRKLVTVALPPHLQARGV